VAPDVAVLRARAGDLFVLCSDGISSQIDDADIERCLAARAAGLGAAAADLVALANARGGDDNATVVLVAVGL
jgi:protein phosphatase